MLKKILEFAGLSNDEVTDVLEAEKQRLLQVTASAMAGMDQMAGAAGGGMPAPGGQQMPMAQPMRA